MTVDSTKLTSVNLTFNAVGISPHSLGVLARLEAVQLTFTFVITSDSDPRSVPILTYADFDISMQCMIPGSYHSC